MRQILLALILIAIPVAVFAAVEIYLVPQAEAVASLGDVSALQTIVADTATIAKSGDLIAAEKRISDFESAWDDGQSTLQPKNPEAWGAVDGAADKAIRSLRAASPDSTTILAALSNLTAALDNPSSSANSTGTLLKVSGIAVTDEKGHALPCEALLAPLREKIKNSKMSEANLASANDLVVKATERCNADDDAHADEFSAQGLALATN